MYFEELTMGMTSEMKPVVMEKEKMLAFARAYDPVPLHTDEEYARKTPFGALIAPGVLSFLEVWVKYLEVDFIGEELLAGKSMKIEWLKPVFAGDVLTGRAFISALARRSERNGMAEITLQVYNQKGDHVLTGVIESVVRCREQRETAHR